MSQLGRYLTIDEFRQLLDDSGAVIVDGDNEDDNVVNTDLSFRRLNIYNMAEAILSYDPATYSSGSSDGEVPPQGQEDGSLVGDDQHAAHTVVLESGQHITDINFGMTESNRSPIAVDDAYEVDEDCGLVIAAPGVLGNDIDEDNDPLTAVLDTDVNNGTLVLNLDGSFTYSPDTDFSGIDSFIYIVSDGNGGTDTATVTITVNEVVPQTASIGDFVWHDLYHGSDHLVDGIQDAGEPGLEGVIVNLLDTTASLIASTISDATGYYEFADLSAGTYIVEISPDNFLCDGVLEGWYATLKDQGSSETNDSDGDRNTHRSGPITVVSGEQRTDIDFGFFTAKIELTKTGPQTAQVGETITYHFRVENRGDVAQEGGAQVYDPMIEPDCDHKIWDGELQPGQVVEFEHTYTITADDAGELVNTASAIGHPVDPEGYYLSNVTDVAVWIVVVVPAPNNAPVSNDDAATTTEGTSIDIDILANDTDADGDSLSISSVSQPANGSVVVNADETITYTPITGFTGEDSFTYTVDDGKGGTSSATVIITVNPAAPASPVRVNDYVSFRYGRMLFNRRTGQMSMDVMITNTSSQTIGGPLQLVMEGISTPDVTLANPDGQTSDGKNYIDLTDETGDGILDPGESVMVRLYFVNPFRRRFTFELGIWGVLLSG